MARVGLDRVTWRFFSFWWVGSGPLQQKCQNFERIVLMHLKHGLIRCGCTRQLNLSAVLGQVQIFPLVLGRVGSVS